MSERAGRSRGADRVLDWLRAERAVVALVGGASAVAFVAWGGRTRPMDDTVAYRFTAEILRSGWHEITERTAGYPLLLVATGADRSDNAWLFLVQLGVHAVAVLLVVDLARRLGVAPTGRVVLAGLLLAPPVLMKAVYAGTEVWAEAALVAVVWLLARWDEKRRWSLLVAVGALLGVVTWIRPTYQLLVVPLALAVVWLARRERPWRSALLLAAPTVVIVGALVLVNAVRFDVPGTTNLLPYHLSAKTALFVEELPPTEEPARSILLARRDQLLVEDPEHSAAAFAFDSREALADATGRSGPDLDREVLRLDLLLLRENPLAYTQAVVQASARFVQVDPQEASAGGHAPLAWLWALVHLGLVAGAALVLLVVPGLALARGVSHRAAVIGGLAVAVAAYNGLVSVLLETGHPRLRAPSDPLIVLLLVAGAAWALRVWHERVAPA